VREAAPLSYMNCCGQWHEALARGEHAPTPEALMRSRYSAYALAQGRGTSASSLREYLLRTWHPSTAPGDLALERLHWTGLEVLHCEQAGETGAVEFVAHHKASGRAARLHEASRFVREAGAWLYLDGATPPSRANSST
jgi:SEC-C motif domain protein